MKRLIAALLLVVLPAAAFSQATGTATVSWVAPTTNTDGSAISGTLTYNLYQGASSSALTQVQSGISVLTATAQLTAGACFAVTAVESGTESAKSSTVCVETPSAPSGVTVTVSVSVSSASSSASSPSPAAPVN